MSLSSLPPIWGNRLNDLVQRELSDAEPLKSHSSWKSFFSAVWSEVSGGQAPKSQLSQQEWTAWVKENQAKLNILQSTAGTTGRTYDIALFALDFAHALEERYENEPQKANTFRTLEKEYCVTLAQEMGDPRLVHLVEESSLDPVQLGHSLANLRALHENYGTTAAAVTDASTALKAYEAEVSYNLGALALVKTIQSHEPHLESLGVALEIDYLEAQGDAFAGIVACQAFLSQESNPTPQDLQEYKNDPGVLEGRVRSTIKMLRDFSVPKDEQILLMKQFLPAAKHVEQLLDLYQTHLTEQGDFVRNSCVNITEGLENLKHAQFLDNEAKLLVLGDVLEDATLPWNAQWNIHPDMGLQAYQKWALEELKSWQIIDEKLVALQKNRADLQNWSEYVAAHKVDALFPVIVKSISGFREKAIERLSNLSPEKESGLAQTSAQNAFQQAIFLELAREEIGTTSHPPPETVSVKAINLPPINSIAWEMIEAQIDQMYGQTLLAFPEFKAKVLARLAIMAQQRGIDLAQMVQLVSSDHKLKEGIKVTVLLEMANEA